jgi:hypothetical protein
MKGQDTKRTMDDMSTRIVLMRNIFGLTCAAVQQFNQDLNKTRRESVTRHGDKKAPVILAPQQLDYGDSTYTFRDADVVLGLMRPSSFGLPEFVGFSTEPVRESLVPGVASPQSGLGDCFVVIYCVKNRYGKINKMFPMFMNGVSGIFYDLPNTLDPDLTDWKNYALKIEQNG